MIKYILVVFTIVFSFSLFSLEEGKGLPVVSLRDGEQKFYQLHKLNGKVMVLMAFNLACKFCDPEIKLLNELSQKHGDKLQVYLINADPISKKAEVMEKLAKIDSSLPVLFDKNQDYTEGKSFPYTIITDSNLIVKSVTNGFNDEIKKKIVKTIEEMVK